MRWNSLKKANKNRLKVRKNKKKSTRYSAETAKSANMSARIRQLPAVLL